MADNSQYWAPLVFGRTRNVDFRFLAYPKDLRDELPWVEQFILSAMIDRAMMIDRQLAERPRWAAILHKGRRIAGVVCLHSFIDEDGSEYCRDTGNRNLYLFAGLVSRNEGTPLALPPMDMKWFRPLFEIVKQRWNDSTRQPADSSAYDVMPATAEPLNSRVELNCSNKWIRLFPLDSSEAVWAAMSDLLATQSSKSLATCVGMKSISDATWSKFDNATVSEVLREQDYTPNTVAPPAPESPQSVVESSSMDEQDRQYRENPPRDSGRGFGKWLRSTAGGLLRCTPVIGKLVDPGGQPRSAGTQPHRSAPVSPHVYSHLTGRSGNVRDSINKSSSTHSEFEPETPITGDIERSSSAVEGEAGDAGNRAFGNRRKSASDDEGKGFDVKA